MHVVATGFTNAAPANSRRSWLIIWHDLLRRVRLSATNLARLAATHLIHSDSQPSVTFRGQDIRQKHLPALHLAAGR
jgi:hypothetical protein